MLSCIYAKFEYGCFVVQRNKYVEYKFTIYCFCWVITEKTWFWFFKAKRYITGLLQGERSKFRDKSGIYYIIFGRSWNVC